ncbi:MAG: hypothetical protein IJE14_00005, partial [Clostridia bacterium]|nr:hypothetical protein [Clostridia bacterium]
MDKLILHNCFYLFQSFVEMYSGGRFNGFEGNYFLEREEGYKSKVFAEAQKCLNLSSWHKESIGTGYISECFKNAYKKKGNLIYYQSSWEKQEDGEMKIRSYLVRENIRTGTREMLSSDKHGIPSSDHFLFVADNRIYFESPIEIYSTNFALEDKQTLYAANNVI